MNAGASSSVPFVHRVAPFVLAGGEARTAVPTGPVVGHAAGHTYGRPEVSPHIPGWNAGLSVVESERGAVVADCLDFIDSLVAHGGEQEIAAAATAFMKQGLISESNDPILTELLSFLDTSEAWGEYLGVVDSMIEEGLITSADDIFISKLLGRAKELGATSHTQAVALLLDRQLITSATDPILAEALRFLTDAGHLQYFQGLRNNILKELITRMIGQGLITTQADLVLQQALAHLRENNDRSVSSQILLQLVEQEIIDPNNQLFTVHWQQLQADFQEGKSMSKLSPYVQMIKGLVELGVIQNWQDPRLIRAFQALGDKGMAGGREIVALVTAAVRHGLLTDRQDPLFVAALDICRNAKNEVANNLKSTQAHVDLINSLIAANIITGSNDVLLVEALESMRARPGVLAPRGDAEAEIITVYGLSQGETYKAEQRRQQMRASIFSALRAKGHTGRDLAQLIGSFKGRDMYVPILIALLESGYFTTQSDPLLSECLLGLEEKLDSLELSMLLSAMIEADLITDRKNPLLLRLLRQKGMQDKALLALQLSLMKKGLLLGDADLLKEQVAFLSQQKALATEEQLPINYLLKLAQLATWLGLKPDLEVALRKQGRELMVLLEATNQSAKHESSKIDLTKLRTLYEGLANMQVISSKQTNGYIKGYCQRGHLPFLEQDITVAARLSVEETLAIREIMERVPAVERKPVLMRQLIYFAQAFRSVEIPQERFARAALEPHGQAALLYLATNLVGEVAKRFRINVNLGNRELVARILDNWNFNYFGEMVAAADNWNEEDQALFRLVLRTSLEGRFAALMYPEEYPDEKFANYSEQELVLIARIRAHNANFRAEAAKLGVDVDLWIHPDRLDLGYTAGREKPQEERKRLLRDFTTSFIAFEEKIDELTRLQREEEVSEFEQAQIDAILGQKMQIGATFRRLVDQVKAGKPLPQKTDGILAQSGDLVKLAGVLLKIKNLLPIYNIPDAHIALSRAAENILRYSLPDHDRDKTKHGKVPRRLNFWDREKVGRNAVIANQVDSCTSLGENDNAIFEFMLDLGTIYLKLEDRGTGQEKGYVRLWLGKNDQDKAFIVIDSADGEANKGAEAETKELLAVVKKFADRVGVGADNVVGRMDFVHTDVSAKVGNSLTGRYFHHTPLQIPQSSSRSN
ncbi:MAG: hypothetical protein ABH823_01700 [bacterium]